MRCPSAAMAVAENVEENGINDGWARLAL